MQSSSKSFKLPDIEVIMTTFPLHISQLDFDTAKKIVVSQIEKEKIQRTILDYYFNECGGDSSETNFTIKDTYFNTVKLSDSTHTAYLIILKHIPSGRLNSKILFYDNNANTFSDKVIDFNIHGLYGIDNGQLKATNLKEQFKINTPEIELVDYNKDRRNDFKVTRLYHNGTANAIETTILNVSESKIDTLDLKQKWIGLGVEKY